MNIQVNNNIQKVDNNYTLRQLIDVANLSSEKGVAAAVNNHVVKRNEWGNTFLKENDKILLVRATQGG